MRLLLWHGCYKVCVPMLQTLDLRTVSLFPSEVGSATLQHVRGGVLRLQFVGNKIREELARLQASDAAINAALEILRYLGFFHVSVNSQGGAPLPFCMELEVLIVTDLMAPLSCPNISL